MIPTPHIQAKSKNEIADTILLPGDPLRAKFIADTFLKNPILFNETRGMLGYTGEYEGRRISVMGTGMGIPSIGIYSWELIHEYGVKNLIRIGSAGSLQPDLHVRDIVIGLGACTNFALCRPVQPARNLLPHRILAPASKSGVHFGKQRNPGSRRQYPFIGCFL